MKKTTILMGLFFVLLVFNVSAIGYYSFVTGIIYSEDGSELGGANVTVTCNDGLNTIVRATVSSKESTSKGVYFVPFGGDTCPDGSVIHAEASNGDSTGSAEGEMDDSGITDLSFKVNFATVDVFIPEFGTIAAGIAVLGSLCGVFLIRKRNL